MPTHHVERVLPYAPGELFTLVGDVERYPEFVPWITSMQAEPPQEVAPGVDARAARAGVGFAFLSERFTTRVQRDRPALQIDVGLIDGPFRRLENRWRFVGEGEGARVVFDIDFAFRRRVLDLLLQANFDRAMSALIGCFEARARALYGRPGTSPPPA